MRFRLIIFIFLPVVGLAQPYNNSWIDYNQDYFKITLAETGIYQIGYDDLVAAGLPVDSTDPRRIQIYHRGEEIAINIEGDLDFSIDPGDYIEFYGQKNDGTLDSMLYLDASFQPHKYYNLYSDTAAYFLTVNATSTDNARMDSPSPFTGATPDTYYWEERISLFTEKYAAGYTFSNYSLLTQFDIGEGWTSDRIKENGGAFDFSFTGLDNQVTTATDPQLELLLLGRNDTIHTVEVFAGPDVSGLSLIGTYTVDTISHKKVNASIPWSAIGVGGEMVVRLNVVADGGINSNISVSYIKLRYPRETDHSNKDYCEYDLQVKGVGGNEIEIINTQPDAKVFDITDPYNVKLVVDTDGTGNNTITCGFLDATSSRKLAVGIGRNDAKLEKLGRFRSIAPADHNYIIITHASLIDAANDYAVYRSLQFDTLVVDIAQLYNQFSFGEISPLAIYNFMEFMANNGTPEYLMIIGKGLDVSLNFHRQDPTLFSYHDLVPTAGSPGSDLAYTIGLNGNTYENYLPTGRLSASTVGEVTNYLNKVKEMESLPFDKLWRKNILHLSGGKTSFEQNVFKGWMDQFKSVAEGKYLGGKVTTVAKATTALVENKNVSEEVNNGLNLINFFGHSAPNVTDIDIGFVSQAENGYANQGKYPMMLINGCNAGNIYIDTKIFAEDWILTGDKGATAVMAHSSFGWSLILESWTDIFYDLAYGDSLFIQKPIGAIHAEVGKLFMEKYPDPNYRVIAQYQQMGLQGDPALKLFGTNIPDYEIKQNYVDLISYTDDPVTSSSDSFALALAIPNYGGFVSDSLEVIVVRRLKEDLILLSDTTIRFSPVSYLDTLIFPINNQFSNTAGANQFEITLDPAEKISERDEFNNSITWEVDIPSGGTRNISPLKFSIQSTLNPELLVQAGDALAGSRGYRFELDTTVLFAGGFTQPSTLNDDQPVMWTGANLLTSDSTAYYWRTRYDAPEPYESDEWTNSTFTYIAGNQDGWAQVAYHQMVDNKIENLVTNEGERRFEFRSVELPLQLTVHGANSPNFSYENTQLIIDGLPYIFPGDFTICSNNKLHIVAFNQENAAPYAPVPGLQEQPWTCGRAPQVVNSFPAGKTLDEILDAIPIGERVLIFTTGSFDFNTLTPGQLSKLEELGADPGVLGTKQPAEPYILLGYRGAGATNALAEIIADPASATPTDEQSISYSGEVVGYSSSAKMTSPLIGPALSWNELVLIVITDEPTDDYSLKVFGLDLARNETELFSNIQPGNLDISGISTQEFPYLKLELTLSDELSKTPPLLDKWLVTYELPAEGLISYLGSSEGEIPITIEEGKELIANFLFTNISGVDFTDSITVYYHVTNLDQKTSTPITEFKIQATEANVSDTISLLIPTKGLVGKNNLEVFVNPFLIPEQLFENNQVNLQEYFTVTRDATNPLLDVTFDGEHIFDGDIVAPNPTIRIEIDDNNEYLLKEDTVGIDIFLKKPCVDCIAERISLSGTEVTWTAETENEAFIVNYSPQNLEDGMYELSVQAEDVSGNKSGKEPYVIHFEVINKSTITNFYPYPNPFSTNVRFIFTLTGNEIPDQLMIRIFTVSGRVVREIMLDELGPIGIGNNITDFAWDGRDEFGDQLANGVYLYKVYLKIDGKDIELRQTAGDKGFDKGYGKLYLLR